MDEEKRKNTVFVTVGTTCFDALVKAVDTQQVKEELSRRGYTELVIQMGRGTYVPSKSSGEDGSLAVDYFTFSPSIADYMRSASLVISHAGSGSIFETLRLGKPLIVVVNEDLMDNHQSELAEELAERKHLFCARPQSLHQTIKEMNLESLLAYSSGDAMPVVKLINRFLGFPSDIYIYEKSEPHIENEEFFLIQSDYTHLVGPLWKINSVHHVYHANGCMCRKNQVVWRTFTHASRG